MEEQTQILWEGCLITQTENVTTDLTALEAQVAELNTLVAELGETTVSTLTHIYGLQFWSLVLLGAGIILYILWCSIRDFMQQH